MGQSGKTICMAWLLSINRNPYTVFDNLGIFTHKGFKPLNPKAQAIVKPTSFNREDLFQKTCKDVWAKGNHIFVVDELSMNQTKHVLPPDLNTLINQGGNRNIAYWFSTRRVAQIHNDILGSCQHHFIFATYLPQDVDWYSDVVPKHIIEQSQRLPPFHFIYYRLGSEPRIMKPVPQVM